MSSIVVEPTPIRARPTTRPRPGKTWFRVDPSRISSTGALGISSTKDPTGIRALAATAPSSITVSGRSYRGTVDLTKVAHWGPVNTAQLAQLGPAARAVPFEASVDDQGRLATMKVAIPGSGAIPANAVTATFSDFGVKVPVDRPAGAEPLPDTLYAMLGLS